MSQTNDQIAALEYDSASGAGKIVDVGSAVAAKSVSFTGVNDTGGLSASAALSTNLTGTNNDLTYTAAAAGLAGNSTTVAYVNPGTGGASLSVAVVGSAITVNLATAAVVSATGVLTSDNTGNVTAADAVVTGAKTYTYVAALTEAKATGTITSNNTNVSNGDYVNVNGKVYTFKTILDRNAGTILIAASADLTLTNLVAAINGSAGAGTAYGIETVANPYVTAGAVTSHATTLTAVSIGTAANAYTLTKSAATITVSGSVLSGGLAAVANEIKIGASADASLTNLAAAINGTTGSGTTYSSATTINTVVTSSAVASHALTMTAITAGTAANTSATTTTGATLSWGATTLGGGVDAGTITTIASDITTAVGASSPATALATVANKGGNDGTGLVTAMAATPLTGGSDGYVPLFAVTGDVLVAVVMVVQATLTGASATIKVGTSASTAALIPQTTATADTAHATLDSTGAVTLGTLPLTTPKAMLSTQNIIATVLTAAITGGSVNFYCFYKPLSTGATVVAL